MDLIQVMKALSDETRIRILSILKDGDLCVCELEALLDINQSNASRHLNKLTNAKIVDYYKVAKYIFYRINRDTTAEYPFIKDIIEKEAMKLKQCSTDYERLKRYKNSGLSCEDLKEGRVCFEEYNFTEDYNMKPKVAFICVHNSCRSQMAEALGKLFASDVFESYSAGTEVKPRINQDAVRIIKELYGVDMNEAQRSKLITDIPEVDIAVKMGCNVVCPVAPADYEEDWGLEDPTGKSDEEFVKTARVIEEKIKDLAKRIKNKEINFKRGINFVN